MNAEVSDLLDQHLARARAGERSALAALVQAHQRTVYSLALRMLGTRDLAEDLTQDVFMQLHGNLSTIETNRHLGFWLRQVTTNRAIDQLRRRARVQFTPLEDDLPLVSYIEAQDPLLQRHLRALLSELTPPARAVVLLRFQEDLDPAEISQMLNMPVNTVKSHLKRSLDAMREKLSELQPARFEDGSP